MKAVTPAKAGVQFLFVFWIPAPHLLPAGTGFAGMRDFKNKEWLRVFN
jgi:hypothetical protein